MQESNRNNLEAAYQSFLEPHQGKVRFDTWMKVTEKILKEEGNRAELEDWLNTPDEAGKTRAQQIVDNIQGKNWQEWSLKERIEIFFKYLTSVDLKAFYQTKLFVDKVDEPIDELGYSRLACAVELENESLVEYCLKHGADSTKNYRYELYGEISKSSAIEKAISKKNLNILKTMLKQSARLDSSSVLKLVISNSSFNYNFVYQYVDTIEVSHNDLLELIKQTPSRDYTKALDLISKMESKQEAYDIMLIEAAGTDNTELLKQLIVLGADPNYVDDRNQTAFTASVVTGYIKFNADILIPLTKDLNKTFTALRVNDSGRSFDVTTPLSQLISYGDEAMAMRLIDAGCDVNKSTIYGTPLTQACENNSAVRLIDKLIEHGAGINAPTPEGNTPLHVVLQKGHIELAQYLKSKGANLQVKNLQGKYPYQLVSKALKAEFKASNTSPEQLKQAEEIQEQGKKQSIGWEYHKILKQLSELIVLGLETDWDRAALTREDFITIANNDGYFEQNPSKVTRKGNPIRLDFQNQQYPIGYNIHIPRGVHQINKVLFDVYGGNQKSAIDQSSFRPGNLGEVGMDLLQEGVIYVTLNLPDFLQDKNQFNMDKALHQLIHECINHFFQIMSKTPKVIDEQLSDNLAPQVRFYLKGGSFGGRTAVRHGQLFGHTFSGYISHDGSLTSLKDTPYVSKQEREYIFSEVLIPFSHTQDIQDPVLILQNRDDNNVILRAAVDFYEKCVESGKQDLVRLAFFEKGNPLPSLDKILNKGHYLPANQSKQRYMDTMKVFMEKGPSLIPELQGYRALRNKHFIDHFFYDTKDDLRFLSMADALYDQHPEHQRQLSLKGDAWEAIWNKKYKPMIPVNAEARVLANDREYFKQYLDYLDNNQLLTDDVIKDTIRRHAPMFRELYKETHNMQEVSLEDLIDNPLSIEIFKDRLFNIYQADSLDFRRYLLEQLLMAHPELTPPLSMSRAWNEKSLEEAENSYKAVFESRHQKRSQALKKTWVTMGKTLHKQSKQQLEVLENLERKLSRQETQTIESLCETICTLDEVKNKYPQVKAKKRDLQSKLEEILKGMIGANQNQAAANLALERLQNPLTKDNLVSFLAREYRLKQLLNSERHQHEFGENTVLLLQRMYPHLPKVSAIKFIEYCAKGINQRVDGGYPLHEAFSVNDTQLAGLLIEHQADVSIKNEEGLNCLELAVRDRMSVELIAQLAEHIPVTDQSMIFALKRRIEVMGILIAKGGNLNLVDKNGKPLKQLAKEQNATADMVNFLKQAREQQSKKAVDAQANKTKPKRPF